MKRTPEEIMQMFINTECDPEITLLLYYPRRAATKNHRKPIVTIGIGSKIVLCDEVYHHLYIDFDNKNVLQNVIEYAQRNFSNKVWMIRETKKGYHLLVFYPFTRKEVDSYVAKIKNLIDRKWLTLQRKRGFYVIRVAGKYDPLDLRTIYVHHGYDSKTTLVYGTTWAMWIELVSRRLQESIRRGELGWFHENR